MKKTHQYGVMLVLIGATLWGSSSNSLEYLMTYQHFSWDTVLAIRMVVTAAVFLLISGLRGEKLLEPVKTDFLRLLRFTVLGLYTMQVPFTIAIHYSNAATGTVLQYLMPVILLGYYLILERRRPRRREAVAAFLPLSELPHCDKRGRERYFAISREAFFWGILSALYGILYGFRRRSPAPLSDLSDYRLGSLGTPFLWPSIIQPLKGHRGRSTLPPLVSSLSWEPSLPIRCTLKARNISPPRKPVPLRLLNRCPLMRYPSSLWETAWVLWKWRVPCASWSWYGCFPKRLDQMNHHTTHHTNVQANCNIWNSRIFLGGELA